MDAHRLVAPPNIIMFGGLSVWDGARFCGRGSRSAEMPRFSGNFGADSWTFFNSSGPDLIVNTTLQRIQFMSNGSNVYVQSYHDINRNGGNEDLLTEARLIVYHNDQQIVSTSVTNPNIDNYTLSTIGSPSGSTTFTTGSKLTFQLYTAGIAYGTLSDTTGNRTLNSSNFYVVNVSRSRSEFFIRTTSTNQLCMLPESANTTLSLSPLVIVKNKDTINSNIWIIPSYNDKIDDQANQVYQLQNGTNSGGAITLFPDNQLGSWYVAMDYNGRASNSSSTVFSNQWFTNNACNVASATLGSMNIFDMASAAARTTSTNWITLPTPQNGRLLPLGYLGSNTGTQALAFRGAAIDGFSAYNSAGSCNYFYIKGLDQYRTSGIVLMSDSSQYYIIGLNSPGASGTWWTQNIYGGSPPNITGASYTPNNIQYGMCAIQCNGDLPIDHKIYSPAYSSGYTTSNISVFSMLKVRRVVSPYGNIITWIGNGQEYATGINGGTSNVFWGNQQYMRQIYATNWYMCMWYGSQPQSNYFKHFFINEYNWDQNYG